MKPGTYLLLGMAVALLSVRAVTAAEDPFDDFISPLSNPVNFEDPRATTELRPLHVYHNLADNFVTAGGDAHVVAAQARVAIGDRFSIIATKDGYVWLNPESVLPKQTNGWANIGLGAKFSVWRDQPTSSIVTIGLRYETTSGDKDVLQGRGEGVLNPFLSAAWGIAGFHIMGYTAPRIPISGNDSTFWDTSLHADYKLGPIYPLVELNWVHVLDGGRRLPIDQEGFDFFNLGSRDAAGHGVVTMAFGGRWRAVDAVEVAGGHVAGVDIGCAYELPISDAEDLFGWRITSDMIVWIR